MRSRNSVANEIRQLDEALWAFDADEPQFSATAIMKASLVLRREFLLQELGVMDSGEVIVWLKGSSVEDHTVTVRSLVKTLKPLQDAVAFIGQGFDVAAERLQGVSSDVASWTDLRFVGIHAGSVALELASPKEMGPQLPSTLGDHQKPIYVRSLEKLFSVADAASSANFENDLLEQIADLNDRSAKAIKELAKALRKEEFETELRWQPRDATQQGRAIVFSREVVGRIEDTLNEIEVDLTTKTINGTLVEASLPKQTFGIQPQDEHEEIVKGKVAPEVAEAVTDYFGKEVIADIEVTQTKSRVTNKIAARFRLTRIVGLLSE